MQKWTQSSVTPALVYKPTIHLQAYHSWLKVSGLKLSHIDGKDGWNYGWMMDGMDGWMGKWMDGHNRCMEEWMEGKWRVDGTMDDWMDGWNYRWMSGVINGGREG
ncbi:hypothetical protein E2320_001439 [Naja naja]|nr:hypothetical protein E2320_001439 [Naja naja]